ncbi:MAG: MFS transporter [Meiothermus sp.]|uniref:MFS transporter n=1 Tax=Meiothermus sp. TaxID=1955249 RepID=UPI0025FF07EC|nr:MFS transporter [Meiothermus sp.]MCS7057370.1 MFS transporter [Meiothermus sp.]MCS7193625.1 MFS transporter [Meiothermus sp.]MCX7741084.1 MFS transporter [Meiothermus sp.]MDW8090639.1 MFS transporter [Meiothermus sp.]MDW8480555.1 MFS transporter [Meiothermus sp.]
MLALALLRDPRYRTYWIALFLSQMGTWMQAATQGWLVLELTHSAERLGLVVALQFLPSLLFSLPAGVLSDRYSRRNLLLLTQGGMAVLALGMFILIATGWVRYPHVLVFAFLYGLFNAMDLPVRQAYTVELAGKERYPGAIALNSFGFNTSRLLGPALAGLLIAGFGLSWSYLVNALSFVPLLWVLLKSPSLAVERGKGGVVADALEGLRFVWGEPLVRQVVLLVGLSSLLGMNFQTIVPAYARLELGLDAQGFGLLMSAVGLGSILAAVLQAITARARPLRAVLGSALLGLSLLALALPLPPGWAAFAFALAGLGMITTLINANTTVQLLAPDRIRGRVMSVYSMVLLGSGPLGAYLSGLLIEALGARLGVGAMGALTLAATLWMVRRPWPKVLAPTPPLEPSLPTPQAASD